MTSFFPDLNVWLALSLDSHPHSERAWGWLRSTGDNLNVIFSRYTQLGLLRLLTNRSVMGENTRTLGEAWAVYDLWIGDPRFAFHPEPRDLEERLRGTRKTGSANRWHRFSENPRPNGSVTVTCSRRQKRAAQRW